MTNKTTEVLFSMVKFNRKNILWYGCGLTVTFVILVSFLSAVLEDYTVEDDFSEEGIYQSKQQGAKPKSHFEQYFETVKRENGTAELIQLAKDIQRNHSLVMVSIINEAFIPFTFSWMCNTEGMNIHQHIIYITTDWQSKQKLDLHWKDTKSVYIPSVNLHGDQEYSKVGYVKMMNLRTQLLRSMLLENITVFLFETDCVWISNPLPEIMSTLEGHDVLLVQPTRGKGVLGGFMVLKPNKATISLWSKLSLQMWKLFLKIKTYRETRKVSKIENDQVYFSKLVKAKYAKINVGFLSYKKFSDGKWYTDFTEKERKEVRPIIINNNWIAGNRQKIERAKKWGHWFLTNNNTCDSSQVSKIVTKIENV